MGGLLVIMGSGETAPTMVKPHRAIFERAGDSPAVLLDTPYGFQENADDITTRAIGYFAASVGRSVSAVSWRVTPPPGLLRDRALAALDDAGWIFAGPGSPTYTLRQWSGTPVPECLAGALGRGRVVVFASAAALTLGSHTVPVYEIYKAGFDPVWTPGMDLIRKVTGLPAVIIPHYDNAEGGHHDTRYCYLGERRLSAMERELPDESVIIGVDEHTAVLLDLDAGTASVVGRGRLTVRRHGVSAVYPAGSVLGIEDLSRAGCGVPRPGTGCGGASPARGGDGGASPAPGGAGANAGAPGGNGATGGNGAASGDRAAGGDGTPGGNGSPSRSGATDGDAADDDEIGTGSLRADADRLDARYARAYAARDVDGCVAAILDLEQLLVDWSADTLTSDEGDHARAVLRRMVVRLGELAVAGARDPREVVGPFVAALLELRARARAARDFATSDWVRDRLVEAGIEVRDTTDGVAWVVRPAPVG